MLKGAPQLIKQLFMTIKDDFPGLISSRGIQHFMAGRKHKSQAARKPIVRGLEGKDISIICWFIFMISLPRASLYIILYGLILQNTNGLWWNTLINKCSTWLIDSATCQYSTLWYGVLVINLFDWQFFWKIFIKFISNPIHVCVMFVILG